MLYLIIWTSPWSYILRHVNDMDNLKYCNAVVFINAVFCIIVMPLSELRKLNKEADPSRLCINK